MLINTFLVSVTKSHRQGLRFGFCTKDPKFATEMTNMRHGICLAVTDPSIVTNVIIFTLQPRLPKCVIEFAISVNECNSWKFQLGIQKSQMLPGTRYCQPSGSLELQLEVNVQKRNIWNLSQFWLGEFVTKIYKNVLFCLVIEIIWNCWTLKSGGKHLIFLRLEI